LGGVGRVGGVGLVGLWGWGPIADHNRMEWELRGVRRVGGVGVLEELSAVIIEDGRQGPKERLL